MPLEGLTINEISKVTTNIVRGAYSIYVDLRNGNVNIAKTSRKKACERVIGRVCFVDDGKKKTRKEFYHDVRMIIMEYDSSGALICRTTAIKQFGKEYISKFEPVLVVNNPYYKCSAPMCLYDKNVLDYNKKAA